MSHLLNKNIVLGVTGGIAAYKSAELTRLLIKQGAQVRVVMTPAATEFVQPLTFQALSGYPVSTLLLDEKAEMAMGHIELARWADAIVVAPASADFIAKLTHGEANNLLLTVILASDKPLFIAPAMNEKMYHQQVTQANLAILDDRDIQILGPASGSQACGDVGFGRMLEAQEITEQVNLFFMPQILNGVKVLITAGPTHEAIDPVRYIANKSSGKMGYALARMAIKAGAEVTLVSGPTALAAPKGCNVLNVTSASDMYQQVMQAIDQQDIFIACAAVADYTPEPQPQKIKKSAHELVLKLKKTKDILASVSALALAPFSVGFAAETNDVENYAKQKLENKKCDLICANKVGASEGGFGVDENAITAYWKQGEKHFKMMPKLELAKQLIGLIAEKFNKRNEKIKG